MNAKEYLGQIWALERDIESRVREKERYFSTLVGTPVLSEDKVQSSGAMHPDERIAKLVQMGEEIDHKIDKLIDLKQEITTQIDLVNDPLLRAILRDRYVNCLSYEDICKLYHQADRTIFRLHGEALQAFIASLSENGSKCQ